jgi:glutathione S-transferase
MRYKLYYWPSIPGRGEFVRLALEECGAPYRDIAREDSDGMAALVAYLDSEDEPHPPFAPPFLVVGKQVIGQTANILLFLGEHHGLAPKSETGRLWVHQLQLTLADLVAEIHDSHHPIAAGLYYEEQKAEAARRAQDLRASRLPKFFGYFDRVLERNPKGDRFLVGARLTYADLSLFHVIGGVRYAFPKAAKRLERKFPRLTALHDRVAARPRIAAYLASDRRLSFNQQGIFRHYPELDG